MPRKIGTSAKPGSHRQQKKRAEKPNNRRKMALRKTPAGRLKPSAENPVRAAVRPPPPGQGKRGEQGYLAYLLRQAQAATRLGMERALADLGVTSPQFVVLTMLKAYPGRLRRARHDEGELLHRAGAFALKLPRRAARPWRAWRDGGL
jgi:hypothetical protein